MNQVSMRRFMRISGKLMESSALKMGKGKGRMHFFVEHGECVKTRSSWTDGDL